MFHRASKLLLAAALLLLCAACGQSVETDIPAIMIARYILFRQSDCPEATVLTAGSEDFSLYLTNIYGLDEAAVEDGAILSPTGMQAQEIAVFRMADADAAKTAQTALKNYITQRQGAFAGYAPEQAALLEDAAAAACGRYALLLICENAASTADAAARYISDLSGRSSSTGDPKLLPQYQISTDYTGDNIIVDENGYELFVPPGRAAMAVYDTSSLLRAWDGGDVSSLTQNEQEVFACCREAVDEVIREGMSDYEKELAIHDWIIRRADYNEDTMTPGHSASEEDVSPYGILIRQTGTCMGYANTFQLFMDLLDIECITVIGASFHSTQDHAWNMVRLNGEWYCVDVTWDDSPIESRQHQYFNVTSDYMRLSGHQWDYAAVPEATAAS